MVVLAARDGVSVPHPRAEEQRPTPGRLPVISNPFYVHSAVKRCCRRALGEDQHSSLIFSCSLLGHSHTCLPIGDYQAQLRRFPAQPPVRRHQVPEGLSLHRSYAAIVV